MDKEEILFSILFFDDLSPFIGEVFQEVPLLELPVLFCHVLRIALEAMTKDDLILEEPSQFFHRAV